MIEPSTVRSFSALASTMPGRRPRSSRHLQALSQALACALLAVTQLVLCGELDGMSGVGALW